MFRFLLVQVVFALAVMPSYAHADDRPLHDVPYAKIWDQYNGATHRICPSHHIEFFTDGAYDTVLSDFLEQQTGNMKSRIAKVVDYPRTCAAETAGFSCEFSAHIAAFKQLGLFDRFVSYSCRNWRCEEAALCDRVAPHS